MTATQCNECGARYEAADDSCQTRFDQLLALDHSRQEPWGSVHALAFAAFSLQHPRRFSSATVARARELIERVVIASEPLAQVVAEFRADPHAHGDGVPGDTHGEFTVTIADLGDFEAQTYRMDLFRWARAAVAGPSAAKD